MTLQEMIYEVYELLKVDVVDDEEIDERLIKQLIEEQRETWYETEVGKGTPRKRFAQSLGEYTLEPVDSGTISGMPTGVKILRTTTTLPVLLCGKHEAVGNCLPGITRVSPADVLGRDFKLVREDKSMMYAGGRFDTNQPLAFSRDNYIYVKTSLSSQYKALSKIFIEAVLRDPTEAPGYSFSSTEYPFPQRFWVYARDHIIAKLREKINGPEDLINNSTDERQREG